MRRIFCIGVVLIFIQMLAGVAGARAMKNSYEKATFAGGCFWGMEKVFSEIDGVVSTRVGYTGGTVKDPDYERVCTGLTGHAEAIEVTFDPSRLSYEDLVEFFFTHHDPTSLNRQGNDIGTQYRSVIFYHTSEQEKTARRARELLSQSDVFKKPIVTEIKPAGDFYAAEDYHQKYLEKNPNGYCDIHLQSARVSEVLRADRKKH